MRLRLCAREYGITFFYLEGADLCPTHGIGHRFINKNSILYGQVVKRKTLVLQRKIECEISEETAEIAATEETGEAEAE